MSVFLRHFDGSSTTATSTSRRDRDERIRRLIHRTKNRNKGTPLALLQSAYDFHCAMLAARGLTATSVDAVIVCVEQSGRIFRIQNFNKQRILD